MFSERALVRLRDILENIEAIDTYADTMTLDAFLSDRRTVDAVERCLQRITEAVIQIGENEMRRIGPEIPFELIRGMGNRLRHEYRGIDARQVYVTVRDELPPLVKR